MDFGAVGHKLPRSGYCAMEDFKKDIELVHAKCRQFDHPLHVRTSLRRSTEGMAQGK